MNERRAATAGRADRGGEFLLTGAAGKRIFTPGDFPPDRRQIAWTAGEFVRKELLPDIDRMERRDFPLVVEKMRKCAALGLFLADVPEEHGGLDLDKATGMLIAETLGPSGSFSITFSGHTGIGTLPLVYYGTEDQKRRYLGRLASGEWIGAYCLTEPDSGSDPLSARATARLSEDGRSYRLTGVKQFITNAAFADLFTVFAKIDGKRFSAFLVERRFPGVAVGPEEEKMGLKGSSTAQVILEDAEVPVENLLGEAGKGHKIAFNVLNIGRLKLAAGVTGMAKGAFASAAAYAGQRRQFGRVIGEFGAIREKLADMTAAIFSCESVVYRVAGLLDSGIAALPRTRSDSMERYMKAIEEYAVECAIAKVHCTEALAYVADEAVQVHGGYGYIRDYPVERVYRDERVHRIFEGTNEINRLLIPTLLIRKSDSGELDLRGEAAEASSRAKSGKRGRASGNGAFGGDLRFVDGLKAAFLEILDASWNAKESQEVLLALADMAIGIFAMETVVLRVGKEHAASGGREKDLLAAVAKAAIFTGAGRFHAAASRCCAYALPGETLASRLALLSRRCAYPADGLLAAKRLLAEASTEAGRYVFRSHGP
ncbi:MAG: acyl-CoA dehydrogenase family protein [Deltaproteobacteria bacterium]|nr:acyl-CoA dehydrogenase family protein [Deltaproteobacteria bacterium]